MWFDTRRFVYIFAVLLYFCVRTAFADFDHPLPLPPSDVVQSDLNSIDDAITGIYVSNDFQTKIPKLFPNQDLDLVEQNLWSDFVHNRGDYAHLKTIPNEKKSLRVVRYEEGDPRTTNVLIDAKKENLGEVILVTDPNVFLEGSFDDITSETAFKAALKSRKLKLKDTATAKEFMRLVAAGFEVLGKFDPYSEVKKKSGHRYLIALQPLYNQKGDTEIPIMHQKESTMGILANAADSNGDWVLETPIDSTTSTHNHSLAPNSTFDKKTGMALPKNRYNRLLRVTEKNAIDYSFRHTTAMLNALGNGESIDKIQSLKPQQIVFKDKTYIESAYTDGKYNPNERHATLLTAAINHPQDVQIHHLIYSDFVYDYKDDFQALRDYYKATQVLKKQKQATLLAVFNGLSFNSIHDWGFPPALDGFRVARPLGSAIFPFDSQTTKRMVIFDWQQIVDGHSPEDAGDLNGPPDDQYLWHDKTFITTGVFKNIPGIVVHTGSLNASGHFANAERQDEMFFGEKSPMGHGFIESIVKVIRTGFFQKLALREQHGVTRFELARLLDRAPTRIDPQQVRDLEGLIVDSAKSDTGAKSIDLLIQKLQAMRKQYLPLKNSNNPTKSDTVFNERLDFIKHFLTWNNAQKNFLSVQSAVSVLSALFFDDQKPELMRNALDFFLWEPNETPAAHDARLKKAWSELFPKIPLPPPPPAPASPDHPASGASSSSASQGPKAPTSDSHGAVVKSDSLKSNGNGHGHNNVLASNKNENGHNGNGNGHNGNGNNNSLGNGHNKNGHSTGSDNGESQMRDWCDSALAHL